MENKPPKPTIKEVKELRLELPDIFAEGITTMFSDGKEKFVELLIHVPMDDE
jgi:hypothetical protein